MVEVVETAKKDHRLKIKKKKTLNETEIIDLNGSGETTRKAKRNSLQTTWMKWITHWMTQRPSKSLDIIVHSFPNKKKN